MPGRIKRGDRDIPCAFRGGQQAVVAGVNEVAERRGGVGRPLGAEILGLDISDRNEHDGVVGSPQSDRVAPRGGCIGPGQPVEGY